MGGFFNLTNTLFLIYLVEKQLLGKVNDIQQSSGKTIIEYL